jgi:hypothetical protein
MLQLKPWGQCTSYNQWFQVARLASRDTWATNRVLVDLVVPTGPPAYLQVQDLYI